MVRLSKTRMHAPSSLNSLHFSPPLFFIFSHARYMRQWDSNQICLCLKQHVEMAAPLLKSSAEILICPAVLTQPSSCRRRDTRSQRSSTGGHKPSPFDFHASWDAWLSILASSRPGGDSLIRPAAVQEAVSHRTACQPKLLLPDRACTLLFFLHSARCLRDTRIQPASPLFTHFAAFFFKHKCRNFAGFAAAPGAASLGCRLAYSAQVWGEPNTLLLDFLP